MKEDKIEKIITKIFEKLHINISDNIIKLFSQIFKFVIVGGIATLIDWIIFYLLCKFLNINPLISHPISFSLSTIYNYFASVKWVFDVNKDKSKKRLFIEFIGFSIVGLLISELLIYVFVDVLSLNEMLSKIMSTAIVMIFNFVTRKIFLEK